MKIYKKNTQAFTCIDSILYYNCLIARKNQKKKKNPDLHEFYNQYNDMSEIQFCWEM